MQDLLKGYSREEQCLIYGDLIEIVESLFHSSIARERDCVIAAGAFATPLLEGLLVSKASPSPLVDLGLVRVYIDPERNCQARMRRTFRRDMPERACSHWKNASHLIAHFCLAMGLREGYALAVGSSLVTERDLAPMLTSVQLQYDYRATLLHVTSDTSPLCSNLSVYNMGDHVLFFYQDQQGKSVLAATSKRDRNKISNRWHQEDEKALSKIRKIHNSKLGEQFFERTIEW